MTNEIEQTMLTTLDNPYNPFTQFDEWNAFDTSMGYNTCSYLARIAKDSEELSETDESLSIDNAINEILSFNLTGNYVKVTKNNFSEFLKNRQSIHAAL